MTRLVRSFSTEAEALTGFRKSARAQRIRNGLLPPPIPLGGRAAAFIADELVAVVAARAHGATDEDIRALVKRLVTGRSRLGPAAEVVNEGSINEQDAT